tara:strand:+ start:149 stop:1396 length:1248 start_codon:yes stop_codon:yes gene_type:complete
MWVIWAGQISYIILRLLGIRILTELLTPNDWGLLALALATILFFRNVFCSPWFESSVRFYFTFDKIGQSNDLINFINKKLIRFTILSIPLLIAVSYMIFVSKNGQVLYFIPLVLGLFVVETNKQYQLGLLNAKQKHRSYARWLVLDEFLRVLIAIALLYTFEFSAFYALLGYFFGSVISSVYLLPYWQTLNIVIGNKHNPIESSKVYSYAKPLAFLAVLCWITNLGDRFIMAEYVSLEEVGLYAAAYGLGSQGFIMFNTVIQLYLRPKLMAAAGQLGDSSWMTYLAFWFALSLVFGVFGLTIIFHYSDTIIGLLLGSNFNGIGQMLLFICVAFAIQGLKQVLEQVIYLAHLTIYLVYTEIFTTLVACFSYMYFIPIYGGLGAAFATAFTMSVSLLWLMVLIFMRRNILLSAIDRS